MGMMRSSLQERSVRRLIMLFCAVVSLTTIARLHAQPFDTLVSRISDLPVDTLSAREKATDDPRMKVALLARLAVKLLYVNRQDECMSTALRMIEIAEPTGNDTLIGRAQLSIGFSFVIANEVRCV